MTEDTVLLEGGFLLGVQAGDRHGDSAAAAGWLSLAVRGGSVAAIGPAEDLRARFPSAQRVDCSRQLILPGFVNAHLHPELQIMKGALEESGLHDWGGHPFLEPALALLAKPENRWMQRAAIRACLLDCLLGGTTCVATYGVTPGVEALASEALREFGMRGWVTIRDVDFGPAPDYGIPAMYRLHAEEALTEEELTAAARAHERGERIAMHAAETRHRRDLARRRFGTTTIQVLARYGLLSPRILLFHCVHVDSSERRLLARQRVPVVSSPTAEMKLGDGIAPIAELVRLGVNVAVGTDAAVCNNGNDVLRELRDLGLTQKLRYGPKVLPAEQILRMGSANGAVALGHEGDFGTLREGAAADLVFLDLQSPRLQPLLHREGLSNAASNVVYACTGQDVRDVMIGGMWRVRDRCPLGIPAEDVWAELGAAASALFDLVLR